MTLTGTGADELFGDYSKWQIYEHSTSAYFQALLRVKKLASYLPASVLGDARSKRLKKHCRQQWRFGHPVESLQHYMTEDFKRELLDSSLCGGAEVKQLLMQVYDDNNIHDARQGFAALDLCTQLPEEFLFMTDRFSMAHSLEARVPFLDKHFMESALSMPTEMRMKMNDSKWFLRETFADLLPASILQGKKKGFEVPISLWLKSHLQEQVHRYFSESYLKKQGIRSDLKRLLIEPHFQGNCDNSLFI